QANPITQVPVDQLLFEPLIVLRHEKHPKGWIGVQLLGCSSVAGFCGFSVLAGTCRNILWCSGRNEMLTAKPCQISR
ncbi:hypothetical protein, partial [Paraburkholderia sp.]|uniref:hypothetical protein n=1 Tax=Paraburkholderia sp. TaxID=1926495 RepID=UPI0025E3B38D